MIDRLRELLLQKQGESPVDLDRLSEVSGATMADLLLSDLSRLGRPREDIYIPDTTKPPMLER